MAGVTVQLIGTGILQPGEVHHWMWHNATDAKVWWFSVDPFVTKYTLLFPGPRIIEVIDVQYRLVLKPDFSQERQVHCWIKNTGEFEARYELRMAFAPAGVPTIAGTSVTPYFNDGVKGTVNTSASFGSVQTFKPPRNLVAFPVLPHVDETDDQTITAAFISEFVDGGKTKTGPFLSISGTAVSQITWTLFTVDSVANPLRAVLFFE